MAIATRIRCSPRAQAPGAGKLKVVVTGAGGRTGGLVAKKLIERKESYDFVGIVRSEEGAEKLREFGACEDSIVVGDILSDDGADVLASAFEGADRLVICTSAVPKIKPLSLIPVFLAKLFKKEGVRPKFTFKKDQMPEQIDWLGQKLQIDIAKKAGVEKCVLVGSMGGTDRSNFLNTIGDGNILVWKRRAEAYLIKSGLDYCIIHPGGLKDDDGGQRELLIGANDEFIASESKYRSIPRADVAELCVAALTLGSRRSIDVVAKEVGEGTPTMDFQKLFVEMTENCEYDDIWDDDILKSAVTSGQNPL